MAKKPNVLEETALSFWMDGRPVQAMKVLAYFGYDATDRADFIRRRIVKGQVSPHVLSDSEIAEYASDSYIADA